MLASRHKLLGLTDYLCRVSCADNLKQIIGSKEQRCDTDSTDMLIVPCNCFFSIAFPFHWAWQLSADQLKE